VSLLLLGAAFGLLLIGGISHSLPITPTGLLAGVGLAFVLAVCLQLSISLSGQQEAIRGLSEANALLGERLESIEGHAEWVERVPASPDPGGVQLHAVRQVPMRGSVPRDPDGLVARS
jgi:hypothetical protein